MNRRKAGAAYEEIAAGYLENLGVKILEKNFRCRSGEIDLIGEDKNEVVFIEVKYRKNSFYGQPWESVSYRKQQKISKTANQYCYQKRIKKQIRYDIVSICGEEILWFQNAFLHQGYY